MKLELTDRQFRYLLDLVYIGNWVLNATRGDDRIEEYDQVESAVFSHCLTQGMGKLVEHYQGSLIPSRAFADGGQPLTRENYAALMERIDAYLSEFDENATEHVSVDLDEGQ